MHFENASLEQARGVVIDPPAGWKPSGPFLETLLGGLAANPALLPVTLTQLQAQVPAGGNQEPTVRHLQSGSASRGITASSAQKIATDRQQLGSYDAAVHGHPPELALLSSYLLGTEDRALTASARTVALNAYARAFVSETDKVTLASEHTVTLTVPTGQYPGHRALQRALSGQRDRLLGQRQVHLPQRELAEAHARPTDHIGALPGPGPGFR